MADILNDGSVVAGSRDLTINAAVYATDNFRLSTGSTEILRTDKNQIPSGRKVTRSETSGSATLQLATTGTAVPSVNDQVTTTEGNFYITSVEPAEEKGGEKKVNVNFKKAITGSITTS